MVKYGRGLVMILAAGGALAACGDDGGSNNPTGDVITGDSVSFGDTTTPRDTTSGLIDTQTGTDTQVATDATAPVDTATDTSTGPPPRMCTDAELETFNTCFAACDPNAVTPTCQDACFDGLSTGCEAAFMAWINCAQSNGCNSLETDAEFAACVADKCPDETAGVYGTGSVEPSDCNVVTNAGCTAEQNCTLISSNPPAIGCAPKGDVPIGGDCSEALCEKGTCLSTDASGQSGQCFSFCEQASDCPDGRPCNVGLQGSDYTFCGDIPVSCSVFAQDCPAGKGCYIIAQDGTTDCATNNGKAAGESCEYLNDCAAGMMCAGNPGKCMKFCNTDGSLACTAGTCTSVGIATVGVCVVQ